MATKKEVSEAARALGRKGGSVKSEAKTATARENGKKGGRPRKCELCFGVGEVAFISKPIGKRVKPCPNGCERKRR